MSRRKSRIIAFQGLYSLEVGKIPLDDVLALSWVNKADVESFDSEEGAFARLLIAGTVEHLSEIDELIKKNLTTWDFDRVNKVSLSVLRMSIFSLLYQKDILPSIVIDEAINISREFGPDDSFKFVNALLDNIRKSMDEKN